MTWHPLGTMVVKTIGQLVGGIISSFRLRWMHLCIIVKFSMCGSTSEGWQLCLQSFDPKNDHLRPQTCAKRFWPPIPIVRHAPKMTPTSQHLQFFKPKSTKIDDKLYDDPIEIRHFYLTWGMLYVVYFYQVWLDLVS